MKLQVFVVYDGAQIVTNAAQKPFFHLEDEDRTSFWNSGNQLHN